MSYVFDKTMSVWYRHVRPLVVRDGKEMLALTFESVLESFHDANHRLEDKVNRDAEVNRAVRELEEVVHEVEQGQPPLSNERCVACGRGYPPLLDAGVRTGIRVVGRLCPSCAGACAEILRSFLAQRRPVEETERGA